MQEKITWDKIFDDFKLRHPNLSKTVLHWHPHSYATILVYLSDGMKLTYNYDEKRAIIKSK